MITFITGNQGKADYLAKYLGHPVAHQKVDVDELQSLDLKVIVEHKARQAYEAVQSPVLVEDVSLEFEALGGLPGPFIKWFEHSMSYEEICSLLDGKSRKAYARCVFGYYDGSTLKLFEGGLAGSIAEHPRGVGGFGFDEIYIPDGYGGKTRAELSEEDDMKTYTTIKPFAEIKAFLEKQS